MKISLIAALGDNNVIGKDNKLLWHLSEDLKWFKKNTLNNVIVMGRKTFESIGKALPRRENIVLTRKKDFNHGGIRVFHSKTELICYLDKSNVEKIYIVGGSQLYRMFLDQADELILTRVKARLDGDTFFPEIDFKEWNLINEKCRLKDDNNEYDMVFQTYVRKLNLPV